MVTRAIYTSREMLVQTLLLLMYIGNTTASIMIDDGEKCGYLIRSLCGYGSYCTISKICRCETGFASRNTRPAEGSHPAIYHCLDTCNLYENKCPTGTTCKDIGKNTNRCDCNEGYTRSLLGQCKSTATEPPQITTKDTVTKETKTTDTLTTDTLTTTEPTKTTDTTTPVVTTSSLNGTMGKYTDKMDSLSLYIGLGVGIASFILIVIILVILVVVIRRRKLSERSPPFMPGEGSTVINNNLTTTAHNARGEGTNQYSESPVDLSEESNVNSNGNPPKNPTTLTQPSRATYHRSAAYEDIDTIFQTEGVDLNSRIPKKSDNSEINSGLKEQNLKDLYSNHKIPDKKGKVNIFNLETSAITEGRVGKEGEKTHVLKKQYASQDTNPYQTPYDLTPFSTNQREETAAKNKALEAENNMNENPYSLAQPIGGAISQNSKMEEQARAEIENDYDELKRQILSDKDKSAGQY